MFQLHLITTGKFNSFSFCAASVSSILHSLLSGIALNIILGYHGIAIEYSYNEQQWLRSEDYVNTNPEMKSRTNNYLSQN